MGIGSGIFLIALGAILTFAIRANVWWVDLRAVGWVFILAGWPFCSRRCGSGRTGASGRGP